MRILLGFVTAGISLVCFFVPENTEMHSAAKIIVYYNELAVDISNGEAEKAADRPQNREACGLDVFSSLGRYEQIVIDSALRDIPCALVRGIRFVETYNDKQKSRAFAGATSMYFRNDLFALPEARKVLIHEFAHIVDLSGLLPASYEQVSPFVDGSVPIFTDDPSYRFYSISWDHNKRWSAGGRNVDFVSGYAATDPFEDFAESFLFYIENGNTFRAFAEKYPRLKKKYDFLRDEVFGGKEFETGKIPDDLAKREWDATRI